jgi:hypothetical protein
MAITQTADRKQGFGNVNPKSVDSTNDVHYSTLGGVWIIVGEGSPGTADVKDAPKGSMYLRTEGGAIYIKTSAGIDSAGDTVNSTWSNLSS